MYDVDEVLNQYIETAIWSSHTDDGDELDSSHDADDLADETREEMRQEVSDFLALIERDRPSIYTELAGTLWADPGQVGHDFWLTRNGHGAGFWDRYYGTHPGVELGQYLTSQAKSYGGVDLYVGDDDKIYQQ